MRQSGNGILITSAPAEVDGALAGWPLRISNDDGQVLTELGTALASGQPHGIVGETGPGYERVLMFIPNHPEEAVGTLARIRAEDGPEGAIVFEGRAERPMALWAETGQNLRRIAPLLHPDAPPTDDPDESTPCPGCYRPVYDSSSSGTLICAGPLPLFGLAVRQRHDAALPAPGRRAAGRAPARRAGGVAAVLV
ncbi:hypothetical protein ABZT27_35435 [Streptomyces sp. NPDC005389]|uniref:hypothetical protein n=1 Tax=Streptomyces sp. NPDC005389 TaxID=3157040 RepID=UPI0033B9DC23